MARHGIRIPEEGPMKRSALIPCASFLVAWLSLAVSIGHRADLATVPPEEAAPRPFESIPVRFVENRGQLHEDVLFYVPGSETDVFFTKEGLTYSISHEEEMRWSLKLDFDSAGSSSSPIGIGQVEGGISYFRGRPRDWRTGIPMYSKLAYRDLWPGIDLVYTGSLHRLEYELAVQPGADPGRIRFAVRGATEVSLDASGNLELVTPARVIRESRPHAFQGEGGDRVSVSTAFSLERDAAGGATIVRFDVGEYDRDRILVIDPAMLLYCGYIGGRGADRASDIAVDGDGSVYVVGSTDGINFPVGVGPDRTANGGQDAFVAKVSPDGTALLYCGYVGGASYDAGSCIDVDAEGNAYIGGITCSTEATFPAVVGPDLTFNGVGINVTDAFVAKVNRNGTALDYCGYIGGENMDSVCDIAVDGEGYAYVTGETSSSSSFPVKFGPDLTHNGGADAFVAKVNADGRGLRYCGYIGGMYWEMGSGVAVDADGRAHVCGVTYSDEQTFPVITGPDLTFNGSGLGDSDAFVARLEADGSGLEYCGYIGGASGDQGRAIALDAEGRAYVAGETLSTESTFPVAVGPDLTYNGSDHPSIGDGFVARIDGTGMTLEYCGYIGGSGIDYVNGIAVDVRGRAYVAGSTGSSESSFPVAVGPDLTFNAVGLYVLDGFVARLDAAGSALDYCGYIGGRNSEFAAGIAVDRDGFVYVAGSTESDETTFPVTIGPDLTFNGGGMSPRDAFVVKVPAYFGCQDGTVDLGAGGAPADVLLVNGTAGSPWRTVTIAIASPITVSMNRPPAGPDPAPFALYAWTGEPSASTVDPQPFGLGSTCFGTLLTGHLPQPILVWNNAAYTSKLGQPDLPSDPAPSLVLDAPQGASNPITLTLQGFIADDGSAATRPGSITNAVIVRVQ